MSTAELPASVGSACFHPHHAALRPAREPCYAGRRSIFGGEHARKRQSSWGGIGTAKDMVDALKVRFDDPQSGWMAQRAYEASSSTSPRESLCFQALSKAQHNARSMKSTATSVGTDVGRSSDIPLSHKWILIIRFCAFQGVCRTAKKRTAEFRNFSEFFGMKLKVACYREKTVWGLW